MREYAVHIEVDMYNMSCLFSTFNFWELYRLMYSYPLTRFGKHILSFKWYLVLRLVSRLVRCWPKTTTDHQLYDHLDLGGVGTSVRLNS